ncbi:unnamed protein product [Brachionus calyciflorus]|uniref:Uncharacterized protein n=1 Tax=Brachionus calyciflorus TaxID=104777 RepID=A0A814DQA8_9BILA|nr:unnamed protein product [Brachionus calyciflorus]
MSGDLYYYEHNTINLILFADGVIYNKSGCNSIWTLMSSIAELPPLLRGSFENIIVHSSWSGSDLDFNLWLGEYNNEINDIIQNGMEWSDMTIKIKILAFISDTPARSKACRHNLMAILLV